MIAAKMVVVIFLRRGQNTNLGEAAPSPCGWHR